MQFNTRMKVMGAKFFNDVVEGTKYDNTKVFVETPMNEQGGNAVGFAAAEYQWGTSENFQKIKSLPFPFEADCVLEMTTNGKQTKTILISITPVARAASPVAAPAAVKPQGQ